MPEILSLFDLIALLCVNLRESPYHNVTEALACKINNKCRNSISLFFSALYGLSSKKDRSSLANYLSSNEIPLSIAQPLLNNKEFMNNPAARIQMINKLTKECIDKNFICSQMDKCAVPKQIACSPSIQSFASYSTKCFRSLNSDENYHKTHIRILPHFYPFAYQEAISTQWGIEKPDSRRLAHLDFPFITIVYDDDLSIPGLGRMEVVNVVPELINKSNLNEFHIMVSPNAIHSAVINYLLFNKQTNTENGTIASFSVSPSYSVPSSETPLYDAEKVVQQSIKKAASSQADLVMFPEMIGTSRMIMERKTSYKDVIGSKLQLVFLPSLWTENKNQVIALNNNLAITFIQSKQIPFIFIKEDEKGEKTSYTEDLQNTDHTVYIYHIPEIGSITVAICRDFLSDQFLDFLTDILHVSIILCPSWSDKIQGFENSADRVRAKGAYSLWLNCCSARLPTHFIKQSSDNQASHKQPSGQESTARSENTPYYVGFLSTPFEQGPGRHTKYYLEPSCQGNCCSPGKPCLFDIIIHSSGDIKIDHLCK